MLRIVLLTIMLIFSASKAEAQHDLNLAATYQAVYAEGLIRSADITLLGVANLFSNNDNNFINDLIIYDSLNRHIRRSPGLRAIFTTDAQGILQYDSFQYPPRPLHLESRRYFKEALGLKPSEIFIGKPMTNKADPFENLPISRPIFSQSGNIKGVAVAIMTPDHLIQRDKVCNTCVVSIYKTNGDKIVSFPSELSDQPSIRQIMKDHPALEIFDLAINQLSTKTVWLNFSDYGLVLLYSHFE
jgi:hypothetical protein